MWPRRSWPRASRAGSPAGPTPAGTTQAGTMSASAATPSPSRPRMAHGSRTATSSSRAGRPPSARTDRRPVPERTIQLRVTRYSPERSPEPYVNEFEVPYEERGVVLDALNHVKDEIDGSLAYRWSCRMGICGSCGMMVNDEPRLTCAAFLRELAPGPVVVEPLRYFPVIRDLVV